MRYLLLLLGLISKAYGQFQPTSAKTAFKNGISIGTRDSTAYTANDSLVVVINRQGRMMYRSTDGYWKLLANAASSDYVPYQGAVSNVFLGSNRIKADAFDLGIPSVSADSIGRMRWNADDLTMNIGLTSSVVLQSGQEMLILVKNQTGVTIPNGTVVRQSGVVGASGRLKVEPFLANGTHNSNQVLGLTTEDIPNGGDGFVSYFGKVNKLNTAAYPDSTILYASPTVAGGLTSVVPEAPNNIVKIGTVVKSASSNGIIFTRVVAGSNINQDEGVQLTNPLNNSLLVYDSLTTLWKDKTLVEIGAVRVQDTAAMLNPYLRKSDTASMLSNYRRKTTLIENADLRNSAITINGTSTALGGSISVGTVTSVTASAPLSSSGGTTPNITISQATTSTNGFLSSTDWNTFNNKQAQLNGTGFVRFSGTTPSYITGTSSQFVKADGSLDGTSYATAASISGTTNYLPKFTSSSAIGNSQIQDNGSEIQTAGLVRFVAGGFDSYISQSFGNTINYNYNQNATAEGWVNYRGYLNGTTQFRNFNIGDGKEGKIAYFTGSSKATTLYGALNGTSLSMSGGATIVGDIKQTGNNVITNTIHDLFLQTDGVKDIIFRPATVEKMRLISDGTLLVNGATTDGTNKLIVNGGVKGTSATFSGNITSTSERGFRSSDAVNGGSSWLFGANSGSYYIGVNGGVNALIIANTGAATFSSSVTAATYTGATTTVSSSTTIADGIETVFVNNTGATTITVTLPSASGKTGRTLKVVRTAGGLTSNVNVTSVNGGTHTLRCLDAIELVSDGTSWRIVAKYLSTECT